MIPEFPQFKKLELSDREDVEKITSKYPPYSDYNFTSMWCWDTRGLIIISRLNGNLVVRFTDYLSCNPFYSFLGTGERAATIRALAKHSKSEGLTPNLKLVPGVSVEGVFGDGMIIEEDPDNFDYLLGVEKLQYFRGNKLAPKRNFLNRFKRLYATSVRSLNIGNPKLEEKVTALFRTWIRKKGVSKEEAENELHALLRALNLPAGPETMAIGVFSHEEMVGFCMCEVVGGGNAILHFEKADSSRYIGIYPYLMSQSAAILHSKGCELLNYEQDLGIDGLRTSKQRYYPVAYLKKYVVRAEGS